MPLQGLLKITRHFYATGLTILLIPFLPLTYLTKDIPEKRATKRIKGLDSFRG